MRKVYFNSLDPMVPVLLALLPLLMSGNSPAAVIYQLPVRTWLATGNDRASAGQLADLGEEILAKIRALGVDHLWLTGVIEHATPENSDPDAVKGNAGSYYAIHDAWDVDPAVGTRDDFVAAVRRAHKTGLRVMVDLVPNHTARTHRTDVPGKFDFGARDDTSTFFSSRNNYFYMPGETFIPPRASRGGDGQFDTDPFQSGIQPEMPARVTGNNVRSARPSAHDWYETAKLNYGFDFTTGRGHYDPRPVTWDMMVSVAYHWMDMGVDGFRIDFAHAVPLEFWGYFSQELRKKKRDVFLLAEGYENDHGMRTPGFSYEALMRAGIDSVYQSELYWGIHDQARGHADAQRIAPHRLPFTRQGVLSDGHEFTNYVENHDEIRVASHHFAPGIDSHGARARYGAAMAAHAALLPGNFLVHGGQELGEDASLFGPYAGDNGKTSIFDFIHQPAVRQWLDGRPGVNLENLRSWYRDLLSLRKEPAFAAKHAAGHGSIVDLSGPNHWKPEARWIAAYVRHDPASHQAFLVVTNTDPVNSHETTIHFTDREHEDSTGALRAMGITDDPDRRYKFIDRWTRKGWSPSDPALGNKPGIPGEVLYRPGNVPSGLYLGKIPPGTTLVLEVLN